MTELARIAHNVPAVDRLTVIIPLRVSAQRLDTIDRLSFSTLDGKRPGEVGFLVIDDGSPASMIDPIRQRCDEFGFGYVRLDTEWRQFSVGRCRNYGAMHAKSKYILFQDVDLMPYGGFYFDLCREINVQNLDDNVRDFLMIPYVFLTARATADFVKCHPTLRRQQFLQHSMENNHDIVEKISTGTSATVYNREYFLTRGGNDPDFEGWGFEDLEFNTRCIRLANRFPLPRSWSLDKANFFTITEFKGWKAVYRLFGDQMFGKGIALFHAWHEVDAQDDYMSRRNVNQNIFNTKIVEFAKNGTEPEPLPSKCEGHTLLFRNNVYVYHREIRPKLGELILESENRMGNEAGLLDYIQKRGISRVMFHNPYATERMIMLYEACRRHEVPLIVAERGALPNSLFFDHSGFLADGTSYHAERWDRPISDNRRAEVLRYVAQESSSDDALEAQGNRLRAHGARKKLGLAANERVLFVPLQRPGDSATRFFAGPIGCYDGFIRLLRAVATRLPDDWVLVVKKHPLEDRCPEIEGARAAHNFHVKDLLELCDWVITLNSGTGLLAMLWGKPVMYAGRAFYGHPEINQPVTNADDVVRWLLSDFTPDREKIIRFISYLLHDFYSFGNFVTREVKMPDGDRMTATVDIDFRVIRGLGRHESVYERRAKPLITWQSPLFDRYRVAEDLRRQEEASVGQRFAPKPLAAVPAPGGSNPSASSIERKLRKLVRDPQRFVTDMRVWRRVRATT